MYREEEEDDDDKLHEQGRKYDWSDNDKRISTRQRENRIKRRKSRIGGKEMKIKNKQSDARAHTQMPRKNIL